MLCASAHGPRPLGPASAQTRRTSAGLAFLLSSLCCSATSSERLERARDAVNERACLRALSRDLLRLGKAELRSAAVADPQAGRHRAKHTRPQRGVVRANSSCAPQRKAQRGRSWTQPAGEEEEARAFFAGGTRSFSTLQSPMALSRRVLDDEPIIPNPSSKCSLDRVLEQSARASSPLARRWRASTCRQKNKIQTGNKILRRCTRREGRE